MDQCGGCQRHADPATFGPAQGTLDLNFGIDRCMSHSTDGCGLFLSVFLPLFFYLRPWQELSDSLSPVQSLIEDVNDQAARLADSGVPLSHANLSRLDDLNSRWKVLQSSLDDRYAALCGATRDGAAASGPAVQSFLTQSVQHPWERSITEADVPYYIK